MLIRGLYLVASQRRSQGVVIFGDGEKLSWISWIRVHVFEIDSIIFYLIESVDPKFQVFQLDSLSVIILLKSRPAICGGLRT
jgi:hypothetical protein